MFSSIWLFQNEYLFAQHKNIYLEGVSLIPYNGQRKLSFFYFPLDPVMIDKLIEVA